MVFWGVGGYTRVNAIYHTNLFIFQAAFTHVTDHVGKDCSGNSVYNWGHREGVEGKWKMERGKRKMVPQRIWKQLQIN